MVTDELLTGKVLPPLLLRERGLSVSMIEWAGPEGAPTAVLVHANSLCAAAWERCARELAQRYRVLAYDLRGHGDTRFTGDCEPSFAWGEIGADLVAILRAFGPVEMCITHSFSGSCALLGAAASGAPWRRLALIDPVLLPYDPAVAAKIAEATRSGAPRRFASVEEAAAKLRRNWLFERWEERSLAIFLAHGFRLADAGNGSSEVIEPKCSRDDEAAVYERRVGGEELMRAAAGIETPILVLWAEERRPNESPQAIDFGRELVGQRGNRRLEMLAGYRHFAPMEDALSGEPNPIAARLLAYAASA